MEKRYQVFISSTFQDLENARQEVSQALLRSHCFPSGMELFPATDEEQFEFIKSIIDESDYYILISAGRYGSLHPNSGLSFTEMEYDYAVSTGKPVIRLLHKDPFNDLKGKHLELHEESRRKLTRFRDRLSKNKLVRFWETPSDLKSEVVLSLTDVKKRYPQPGWVRGTERDIARYQKVPRESTSFPSPAEIDALIKRLQEFGDYGVYFAITCFLDHEEGDEEDAGIGPVYGPQVSGPEFLELVLTAGLGRTFCRLDWTCHAFVPLQVLV